MRFIRRRIRLRLRDFARLLRPWFLLPSMFALLAGVLLALGDTISTVRATAIGVGLLVVGPLIAGSCIVFNQVVDFVKDSRSLRKRRLPLVQLRFNLRTAYVLSFVLLAAGLALSYTLGPVFLIGAILASFLGFAYSHPKVRLKERPPFDCIVNGLCFGFIPLILGYSLVASLSWSVIAMALPFFVVFSSGYLLLGLPDVPTDSSLGVRTLPVLLGNRLTVILSIGLVGASGLLTLALVAVGLYPAESLLVLPVLVSIMAMHWRLLDREKLATSFVQLRYLYLVLGTIFLISITM